jgi:hypothetical protein
MAYFGIYLLLAYAGLGLAYGVALWREAGTAMIALALYALGAFNSAMWIADGPRPPRGWRAFCAVALWPLVMFVVVFATTFEVLFKATR